MFDLHNNFNCIKTAGQLELPYPKQLIHIEIKYFKKKNTGHVLFYFGKLFWQKKKRIVKVTAELMNLAKDCSFSESLFL